MACAGSQSLTARALGSMAVLLAATPAALAGGPSVFERLFAREEAELAGRTGRPEAIGSLSALIALEENVAPGRLEQVLRRTLEEPRTDPLVAAQASYRLALAETRRGDVDSAQDRLRSLGLVSEFQVVGPFEAQGRGAVGRPFPPEAAQGGPGSDRRFPGKQREVAWRSAAKVLRDGALAFDGLLRPDSDGVAYALTYLQSDRRQVAVLRVGSPGPVKVWVGGRVVLEKNVVRDLRLDQDSTTVLLEPGENGVLIKSVVTSGSWRLFLRVTDEKGRPLVLPAAESGARYPFGNERRPITRKTATRDLGPILLQRASRSSGGKKAAAWLDYARYLALARPSDREGKEIERALSQAGQTGAGPRAWLLLGELAAEPDERRRALERAAAEAPAADERALALAQLGLLARANRRESAALELLRSALAADPSCLPAVLALAAEEQLAGLAAAGAGAHRRPAREPAHPAAGPGGAGPRAGGAGTAGDGGSRARHACSRAGKTTSSSAWTWPGPPGWRAILSGPCFCTPSWRGSGPICPSSSRSGRGCWKAAATSRGPGGRSSRPSPGCPTKPSCTRSWGDCWCAPTTPLRGWSTCGRR